MADILGSGSSHGPTRRRFVLALGGSAASLALPSTVLAATRPAAPAAAPPADSAQTQPLTAQQFAAKMESVATSFAKLRADAKITLAQYAGHLHTYTLSSLGMTTLNLGSEGELPVTTLQSEETKRSTAMVKPPPTLAIAVSAGSITGQTLDELYLQLPKLLDDANAIENGFGVIRASYELHTHTVIDHQQNLYVKPIYKHNYTLASTTRDYPVETERPAPVTASPAAKPASTFPPLYQKSQQEVFLDALAAKVLALDVEARILAQSVAEHRHPYRANDFNVVPIVYNSFTLRVTEAFGPRTVMTTGVVMT